MGLSRPGTKPKAELENGYQAKRGYFCRRYDIIEMLKSNVKNKIEYDAKEYRKIKYNPAWIPVIKKHRQFLYQKTGIKDSHY